MPSDEVEKYKFENGKTVRILYDEDPSSPREWDNLGVMVCFHKKLTLGDKHGLVHNDFSSWGALEKHLRGELEATHVLPLYLMNHSGLSMSTTKFSDPWDSGQVGFIYTTAELIAKMGTPEDSVGEVLDQEVETFNEFISGAVYGYEIIQETMCEHCKHVESAVIDSCWGFYGLDYCKAEALAAAYA